MPSEQALASDAVDRALGELQGWKREGNAIRRTWQFQDHYRVMAFVNAVAWISHARDHHPDMQVGYNKVTVEYSTHSAGGITEKDLACAREVSKLITAGSP